MTKSVTKSEKTPIDSLEDNVRGRQHAEQLLELADFERQSPKFQAAFWHALFTEAKAHVPLDKDDRKPTPPKPMGDYEARHFGIERKMPYGEFRGVCVDEVPTDRLEWYIDAHEANDMFMKELRRYLDWCDSNIGVPDKPEYIR